MEPFQPEGNGDFWKAPERYMNAITDADNKLVRRKTLSIIYDEIRKIHEMHQSHHSQDHRGGDTSSSNNVTSANNNKGEGDSSSDLDSTYVHIHGHESAMPMAELKPKLIRPLMKCICDSVERCRETAYDILTLLVSMMNAQEHEESLPLIMPVLVDRFGQQEIIESSEEVRFTAIKFVTILCETVVAKSLLSYVEDLTLILSYMIVDPFHSVRIASCKVTSYLAMKTKQVFHYTSDRLIGPLCTAITHQQYRVRCAVLECLGDVLLHGSHKSMNDVLPHVTQRLFDSTPNVRKCAISVAATWALDFIDRYSYFQKLLPIVLTGLSDESPENSKFAYSMWKQVGEKYLQENLDEYKDSVDFPKDPSSESAHSPFKEVERPIFGCRILVWRNLINILPGVVNDITDWAVTTRIKCAQILYQLVLHGEDKITMHVQKIIQCIFLAISDECPIVVDNVQKTAKLVGWFAPLATTLPIITTGVQASMKNGPLKTLRSLIEGVKVEELEEEANATAIGELISDKEICYTFQVEKQNILVDIVMNMSNRAPMATGNTKGAGKSYLRVVLSTFSLTQDSQTKAKSMVALEKLREISNMESVAHLVDAYCFEILNEIKENSSEWVALSPDKLIFENILSFGGVIVDNHMDNIIKIMVDNLSPKRNPEVRLRFFSMLAENLQHCQKTADRQTQLHTFVRLIIQDILTPNLVWVAGKTAGALRTAAVSCVLAILNTEILPSEILVATAGDLVPGLVGLLDDNSVLSRHIACQSLEKLVSCCDKKLSPDIINQIYPALLKRLDDVSNDVRLCACATMASLFSTVPESYDVHIYKLHIQSAISSLIVHLDDNDEEIQEASFDALKVLGKMQSEALIEECHKFRLRHRTPDLCDKLIAFLSPDK